MQTSKKLSLLCLALLLAACAGQPAAEAPVQGTPIEVAGGSYNDVSVAELQTMLENKDFLFINVHIPFEGDIANTDLSIPYDEIADNLDLLPAEKDAKIVLYCRSDRMSRIAAETLIGLGFTNLYNLDGGMVAWEAAGLELQGQ
ncbi:MAG: rhodanese-like domain-containing protein [Anaerolineae bacterium]|nr:MAG: rhodanese-like domain-containing protein [Anaerolineae bacterium]